MSAVMGLGGETEARLASAITNVEPAATTIAVGAVPVELIWERRFWECGDLSVINALLAASRWKYILGVGKGCLGRIAAWAA